MAVRLFYVRHLVGQACRAELGFAGTCEAISKDIEAQGKLAAEACQKAAPLANAWRLCRLAGLIGLQPSALRRASPEALGSLLGWLDALPEEEHGPVWLAAMEAGYHEVLLGKLREGAASISEAADERPDTQSMYCIDVRSEPFRRSLESVGKHETIGFAGFFGIAIQSQARGQHHWTEQYPAIAAPARRAGGPLGSRCFPCSTSISQPNTTIPTTDIGPVTSIRPPPHGAAVFTFTCCKPFQVRSRVRTEPDPWTPGVRWDLRHCSSASWRLQAGRSWWRISVKPP